MRRFECENCSATVTFGASQCPSCGWDLGYVPEQLAVRILQSSGSDAEFTVRGDEGCARWRCLNAAWGCNWVLPAGVGDVWCRSCRLTRGRPDQADPAAVEAWSQAEAVKRKLIHQLDALGLPIEERTPRSPRGLAFDLVHVPGEVRVTGHLLGVVTLDLTETDEARRDSLRRSYGEPLRTVIGHLRHEMGHYYWLRMVGETDSLDRFRALFGDDRRDYATSMESFRDAGAHDPDESPYITSYAASHPLEDWAESFGHYLHIRDALETAEAHGLGPVTSSAPGSGSDGGFPEMLARWQQVADALNAVADSLGSPAVYPLTPTGLVADKLAFVHERVRATAG